ncbi:MAG: DUF2510 domain-containing protein [Acidimicrobiales bacterium]
MTTLEEPQTEAATRTQAAGWYVDPQNLHHQRFYDGRAWTKHVTHFGPVPCNGCAH